jgi:hypothetical protein
VNTRERFQAVMGFQPFDRLPLLEWANWWNQTTERWYSEGLPADVTDRYDICRHFGLDLYKQDWLDPYGAVPRGKGRGDRQAGILAHVRDYDEARSFMYPEPSINEELWTQWAEEQANGECVLWITLQGFFWFPREVFGVERHLYAFYDEPGLLHRINSDLVEWNIRMLDKVCSICTPDFMTFAEDMSYNHGPMLSKPLFDEFMKPYYEQILPVLKRHGILPIIDSDGDVSVPAHWFEEVGIEGVLPLERQAGVDIARLRDDHSRLRFLGHFDKMTMNRGEAAMRAEFERLVPTAARGGFIVSCDHQTPPGVSYEDYKLYVSLFREYAEEAGQRSTACCPKVGTGREAGNTEDSGLGPVM